MQQNMNIFQDKKIGIWGFGVVGLSALTYFDQQQVQQIEILDTKKITLPATKNHVFATIQTDASILNFLHSNDYILASPGIKLHNYQNFAYKFINELDLIYHKTHYKTVAITGTVGKTSITHLLEKILQYKYPDSIAAGNIGHAMLNLISEKNNHQSTDLRFLILELSSFQLQPIQKFAPDLAIMTNFFTNHLDHHLSVQEYFDAKCNIFKFQNNEQQALIPLNDDCTDIIMQNAPHKKSCNLFFATRPSQKDIEKYQDHTIYYDYDNKIHRIKNNLDEEIFDCDTLPASLTFAINWVIIVAASDILQIPLSIISLATQPIALPDHRLQKINISWNGSTFYNDSKSTVWQATLQAVTSIKNDQPIKLFLGGLSKGADRTPLMQALQNHAIEIYAFGKEAEQIGQLCAQFNIKYQIHATLDASFAACMKSLQSPHNILFSPGGSSFDLFADYKARGHYFTQLVENFCNKKSL
ncbi:UDP-N-acetylmuramoyl-L-alanine--D-glutamate ligase [Candidatus Babeliales bacterium]|nr:UDP-N-acetylmuramoyl-L-alanine--D-glutamate ligase [Candidatus Babeliales bacterium]MBP9844038.1 UDP-N-acetylmuramoyl-L-alanine--D-glutamate ligase [Candidatus Babeliales bacterium]